MRYTYTAPKLPSTVKRLCFQQLQTLFGGLLFPTLLQQWARQLGILSGFKTVSHSDPTFEPSPSTGRAFCLASTQQLYLKRTSKKIIPKILRKEVFPTIVLLQFLWDNAIQKEVGIQKSHMSPPRCPEPRKEHTRRLGAAVPPPRLFPTVANSVWRVTVSNIGRHLAA